MKDQHFTPRPGNHLLKASVLFKDGKKILEGKITSVEPNQHGVPHHVVIKAKGGKTFPLTLSSSIVVLVPKSKVPKPWKKILEENKGKPLAVVWCNPRQEVSTTSLVNTKTLQPLMARIQEVHLSEVELYPGDEELSEGKPSMEESFTHYQCGKVDVDIDCGSVIQYS
jgi:hypothetical protein